MSGQLNMSNPLTDMMTLEEQRDNVRRMLLAQRQTHAADKISEAMMVGLLREAFIGEGRPIDQYVPWVCKTGSTTEKISASAVYDRISADVAVKAGITTAKDGGAQIYSHLVAAGRQLQRGLSVPEVQAEVDAGMVSIRANRPEQQGLTKVMIPDVRLEQLEVVRTRVKLAFVAIGHPLPDNYPEILGGMLDLITTMRDDLLEALARDAVDTLERYVETRFERARMVKLVTIDRDCNAFLPLPAVYGSDYVGQLNAERPAWMACQVIEHGKICASFVREDA